jgi:hypothetical protein
MCTVASICNLRSGEHGGCFAQEAGGLAGDMGGHLDQREARLWTLPRRAMPAQPRSQRIRRPAPSAADYAFGEHLDAGVPPLQQVRAVLT